MADNIKNPETDFQQIKKVLQVYQLDRIKKRYLDFSTSAQYKDLISFFFEQIYGPQDFGFRNNSIKTLFKKSHPVLTQEIIVAIESVIELNDLSDELDNLTAEQLQKLNITNEISPVDYANAYKNCNNYDLRQQQIDLMLDTTKRVFKLSQVWFIGASLLALHSFADLLGLGKIMNFLYKGYQAFHKVKDITPFLDAVYQRETDLNIAIFEGKINMITK